MKLSRDKIDKEVKDIRELKEGFKDIREPKEVKDIRELKEGFKDIREPKEFKDIREPKEGIKAGKIIPKNKSSGIVEGFVGKMVNIILRNGNSIKGKLETVAQYELVLTVSYKPVIIMKHGIDYIELVE